MPYVATVNIPGYLPMDDDPPVFDTIEDAWAYLAAERERSEDYAADADEYDYSDTFNALIIAAAGVHGHHAGTIYGGTPGYDGDHDLGLAYTVTETEDTPERN